MANSVASSNQETTNNKLNIDSADKTESGKNAAADADNNPDTNLTKEAKLKRFENEGVEFKAKLIGSELVMEPRGDKMCQSSIQRLKAMIKGLKSHKKRILLKISYDGVKVYDEKSHEILHHHEVPQISYIASDDTDPRTFGYVCDIPNKGHQFICFKTGGPAIAVMSTISSLFETVLEKKNEAEKALRNKAKQQEDEQLTINLKSPTSTTTPATSHSIDLVGDSGIMDNDLSFSSELNFNKQNQQHQQQQQQSGNQMLADSILSYGGGGTNTTISDNIFNDSPGSAWPIGNQNNNTQSQLNQQHLYSQQQLYLKDQQQQQQQQQDVYQKQQSFQQQQQQQSGAANADLLFSDLFFGLSDPIIVGQNDSLVSSKMPLDSGIGVTGNQQQQLQLQQQQQQLSFASGSPNSNQMRNHINSSLSSSQSQQQQQLQQQQLQQQQMIMMQQHQQRMMRNSNNNNSISSNNNPFDANSSMNSNQLSNSGASIMRPRPTPSMQAPQPIPPRTGLNRQSTLNVPNINGVMSPLSLPRPGPMMQEPAQRHNRSLVHNHSSVSLSDAALTRQFSFNISPSNQQPISESYADRYSVFNDIDNLPSIFESASLGNVNSNQDAATMGGRQAVPNPRMSNIQGSQTSRSSNFNFNF